MGPRSGSGFDALAMYLTLNFRLALRYWEILEYQCCCIYRWSAGHSVRPGRHLDNTDSWVYKTEGPLGTYYFTQDAPGGSFSMGIPHTPLSYNPAIPGIKPFGPNPRDIKPGSDQGYVPCFE